MSLKQAILNLHQKGLGKTEISKKLGCTVYAVRYNTDNSFRERRVKSVIQTRKGRKLQAIAYKGGKCIKCGYQDCVDVMVFHHRDPLEKDILLSGTTHTWDRIKSEIDKCVLLCCRCHTELHAGFWTQKLLKLHGLKYVPAGINTGKLLLPPSKRLTYKQQSLRRGKS